MGDRKHSFSEGKSDEDPPHSRLFIICSKQVTEDDLKGEFSRFGNIEEIWVVHDRQTGERKGVAYIKYSKTSEAAAALEAMNGKLIANCNRRIKVMIAASREQGSKREANEEEKLQRLFVLVPKTLTDDELYETFKQYGDVDYAHIVRDRETKESKGFAYVKYFKFSDAATAFEECDRKFKPVFAEPRKPKQEVQDNFSRVDISYQSMPMPSVSRTSISLPEVQSSEYYTKLQVITGPYVNQDQLWRLFDIVPGMEFCELRLENSRSRPARGVATVAYNSSQSAAYAREKLHGFEYPPGSRLIVKPEIEPRHTLDTKDMTNPVASKGILELAETIAKAKSLLQAAKGIPGISDLFQDSSKAAINTICSVSLPDPMPLADVDCETAARCFIVCSPNPPPISVLKDVFCRFGNLIDVFMLNGRNCGYAKYAVKESAEDAIKTLHGAEVCGIRMKVLKADEPKNDRKRMKLDINPY